MRKGFVLLSRGLALCFLFAAVCSCARTEPSRFYTLRSVVHEKPIPQTSATIRPISIGIGPVEIPEYLDRPQIVTRNGPNELKLAEFDRWAGPLDENISVVLAENLSSFLPSATVVPYPWGPNTNIDYQVSVKLIHLEGVPDEAVSLQALWTLASIHEKQSIISNTSRHTEKVTGSGYEAMVAAMGRSLLQLSREIASVIEKQTRPLQNLSHR